MKLKHWLNDVKQNTKNMTRPEVIEYIWTYYRVHILVILFLLIFAASLSKTVIKNSLSDPVLSYGVVERVDIYCGEAFDQIAAEAFPEATGFRSPEHCIITSPTDESNPYGPVQLVSRLAAGDLDVVIADMTTADYLIENGAALDTADISNTDIGKQAEKFQVSPLIYIILSKGEEADQSESNRERRKAAEHFLKILRER